MDVFTFGRSPVSLDLMTTVKGLDFDESIENAIWFKINENLKVITLNKRDLIKAKKASGRYRDLDDIENLE